nr:unnamed protein product [Callosobruchus chinensis]
MRFWVSQRAPAKPKSKKPIGSSPSSSIQIKTQVMKRSS